MRFLHNSHNRIIHGALSIISFGINSRVVVKFETDRFRTFGENREEKKIKKSRRVNHIRSPLLHYARRSRAASIENTWSGHAAYEALIVS